MSQNLIRPDIVRQALSELHAEFRTKDLSEHPIMLDGHPTLRAASHYHAWVGAFLSQLCSDVSNISRSKHARGAKWRNQRHPTHLSGEARAASAGEPADPWPAADRANKPEGAPAAAGASPSGIGPQYAGDNAFTGRMRLHQSWYRAQVLGVPCGTGPQPTSQSHYGNMLRTEDAERGLNFVTPEVFEIAMARLHERSGTVEPFRLLHNMLSSQPMCFNLFGLLTRDTALATTLLQAIPELQVAEVLQVKLEFAPEPAYAYLNDRTAFDAFVEYRHADGGRALLGIETKLTEPFSAKQYDSPNYRRWMSAPRAPWTTDGALRVSEIRHNQLWRDHLLAIAMRDQDGSPYQHATLMLVRHPLDHQCARIVQDYATLLRPGDQSFLEMPLDLLLSVWRDAVGSNARRPWLDALVQRYIALDESEGARHE